MKKVIFFMFLSVNGWAACPLYTFPENHKLDQEFNNECDNITNPIINYAQISSATITAVKVSTLAFSDNTSMTTASSQKIFQIVTAHTTTQTSTTSSTFQAATNFTVSITPSSASHRILILVSGDGILTTSNIVESVTVKRGSTDLSSGSGFAQGRTQGNTGVNAYFPFGFNWVDSPATTSATTYQVYFKNADGSSTVFVGAGEDMSITVLEII